MTLALGIDPGTATTGYGLVRLMPDGELVAVDYGVILTPKESSDSARLVMLFDELNKILKKHKPETAAVEKLFFARNVTTGITVGQARGVVLLALEKAKITPYEYSPTEVKNAVAGYGHAEKRQMQEMVRTLLQLEKIPKPDDAADALAVAITHLNTARYDLPGYNG
ncbi:MAG: crossover junction endodeoxyribonuclease RuvC [Anaerolineales bacterium]|nr:crossover junction endodeoxyribonuclease RuvC [Anaerolineales bacterium]MCB9146971.1 crossover junction endodeoxyribonuclease RuvC [Anaerolineales bacterium]